VLYKKIQKEINNLQGTSIKGITSKEIKSFIVPLPSLEIQQKIADILSTQDKLIELKQKLIDNKKQQKKWIMQNLLTGKIRLDGFSDEWKKVRLGDYIVEYTEKTTVNNQYPVLTSSRRGIILQTEYFSNHQITTDNNIGYNVIPKGYITYRSRSDDGNFKFNENKIIERGIISYFYPVFSFIDTVSHYSMLELLNFEIYQKIYPLIEGTAQQVLSFKKLGKLNFFIPPNKEQNAIAEILSAQDKEIELLEKELEQEKLKKKALMQFLLFDV
ncbi:MAG: restriction endonuclease subunit S, partial [Ruminococcus sp.]|nr:restriction endonuclease subunit S [Ruminococcus sp.]